MSPDFLSFDIILYYNYLFYFLYPLLDYKLCQCRDNASFIHNYLMTICHNAASQELLNDLSIIDHYLALASEI